MLGSIKRMQIPIPNDTNGMVGRECPNPKCEGYFKIKLGTGIVEKGYDKCYCPYCGFESTQDRFFTKEQIEYAKSIAVRNIQKVVGNEVRKWDRELRSSTRNSLFQIRVNYKQSHRPIAYYAEKELETNLICEHCGLEYAVYGKFAYCPDCGVDNTLQILGVNLDLVSKLLVQARSEEDAEFREYLIQNALEDVISSFDSFGRNCVRLFTRNTDKSKISLSFQNIGKAREKILNEFGLDIGNVLEDGDWDRTVKSFQKRHLIAHNDGIVDDEYIKNTGDQASIIGRKVVITVEEVESALQAVEKLAHNLQEGLATWKSLKVSEGE